MKKARLRAAPALVGVIASGIALGSGPALGAALTKCTMIGKPGSYELTRNLTAAGDCLVVAADFVTIDLGGWAISGDGGTGSGITDQGASRRGIAVIMGQSPTSTSQSASAQRRALSSRRCGRSTMRTLGS